jgi:hypothetical protein
MRGEIPQHLTDKIIALIQRGQFDFRLGRSFLLFPYLDLCSRRGLWGFRGFRLFNDWRSRRGTRVMPVQNPGTQKKDDQNSRSDQD